MGKDRPWKTSFPEHLRRSRSRKPKWQKKMTLKSKELDKNLEKLENRIFAKRREEKMREARMAARMEMGAADFPQFEEKKKAESSAKKPKLKTILYPRLEDPDDDMFLPSEDSSEEERDEEAARKRELRLALKKQNIARKRDPLGLDAEHGVEYAPRSSLPSTPKAPAPMKPKTVTIVEPGTKRKEKDVAKHTPKAVPQVTAKKEAAFAKEKKTEGASTRVPPPKDRKAPMGPVKPASVPSPVPPKQKKKSEAVKVSIVNSGKKMMSAYERRQQKKARMQAKAAAANAS